MQCTLRALEMALGAFALVASACFSDTDDGGSGSDTTGSTGAGDTSSGGGTTGTGSSSGGATTDETGSASGGETSGDTGATTGATTTGPEPACGDGVVDPDMICLDEAKTIGTASEVRGVDMGDLDNDGDDDVVAVHRGPPAQGGGGGGFAFLSNGAGNFAAGEPIPLGCCGYERVKIARIADNLADIVTVDTKEYNIKRARGNGDGTFQDAIWESDPLGNLIFDLIVVDTDDDGYQDFVYANDEFLVEYDGDFNENFTYGWIAEDYLGFPMRGMTHGDFNADGAPDLVVTRHEDLTSNVVLLTAAGTVGTITPLATALAPQDPAVGDFDDDGDLDVAIATPSEVVVFFGDGTGISFSEPEVVDVPSDTNSIVAADMDANGTDDIVTASSTGTVTVSPADGAGSFGTGVDFNVGGAPSDLAVGDANEDDSPDLAIAVGTGTVVLLSDP